MQHGCVGLPGACVVAVSVALVHPVVADVSGASAVRHRMVAPVPL